MLTILQLHYVLQLMGCHSLVDRIFLVLYKAYKLQYLIYDSVYIPTQEQVRKYFLE